MVVLSSFHFLEDFHPAPNYLSPASTYCCPTMNSEYKTGLVNVCIGYVSIV